jgi:hypothetical protein
MLMASLEPWLVYCVALGKRYSAFARQLFPQHNEPKKLNKPHEPLYP